MRSMPIVPLQDQCGGVTMFRRIQIALALVALLAAAPAAPAQPFTIQDLGFLPGPFWVSSVPVGINNAGQVAGYNTSGSAQAPPTRAWRYTPGSGLLDLGSLAGT